MGLLSFLFSSDPEREIENYKKRIKDCKRNIDIIKKNAANKKQAHYQKHAQERIKSQKKLIEQYQNKINRLKKQTK